MSIFKKITIALCITCFFSNTFSADSDSKEYAKRFLDLYIKIKKPSNGYFSPEGIPYHSVETLVCEAPDYGHETTSEAFSYWLWLEGMYGFMTNQWDSVANVWDKTEKYIIPTKLDQPTNSGYKSGSPATYMPEYDTPDEYPSQGGGGTVQSDPISQELESAYGDKDIYGMHWILDVDNWYGYGSRGDGTSKPSYMNTFQRGVQESVWETVPHPSWEAFKWGGQNGFIDIFVKDNNYSKQWRYTNAPDADARMIQAMYWCYEWAKEKEGSIPSTLKPSIEKAAKMGDYLRYSMFDKYFKTISGTNGDYQSAHYLLSWYYSWGGSIPKDGESPWAWRIGCSHNHFGYQNPVAAYVLSNIADFKPKSPNALRDWKKSYDRQFEFYQWLQSAEGAIGGGATSSWKGRYETAPQGTPTFYGMSYTEAPVYGDPPSNSWFGWQAWSMQRMGEIYFITGEPKVENVMDKWFSWIKSMKDSILLNDGTLQIPGEIGWEGQPDSWNGYSSFSGNKNYHVKVKSYGKDLGIAACLARALIHYNFAKKKLNKPIDQDAMYIAKEMIDRIYNLYGDEKGYTAIEKHGDYKKFFEAEIFIPSGYNGKMPNGDVIKPGVKFIDIRSKYKQDPAFASLEAAYKAGKDPEFKYHRFWAQVEIALAFAEYARFSQSNPNVAPVEVKPDSVQIEIEKPSAVIHGKAETKLSHNVSIHSSAASIIVKSTSTHPVNVRIMDIVGRTIAAQQIAPSASATFSKTNIKPGYYFIQYTDGVIKHSEALMLMSSK